jgi:acetolactate synthase small subunit
MNAKRIAAFGCNAFAAQQEINNMTNQEKRHWVFRAHVLDRAGALTSIASAFSNEGISIDTVVGHGLEAPAGVDGSVVMTFWCDESDKDIMVRKVRRLSKVTGLEEHPYESQDLRKSAIITANKRLAPHDVAGEQTFLTCELIKKEADKWMYFLAGSPSELDAVLERLEKESVVKDIVYSIIGL